MKLRSLSTKAPLLVVGLLLTFGAVILGTFSVLSRQQLENAVRSHSVDAEQALSKQIQDRQARLSSVTHYAADATPRVRMLILSGDGPTVQDQAPSLLKEFSVDAVTMVDAGGAVLGEAGFPQGYRPDTAWLSTLASNEKPWAGIVHRNDHLYLAAAEPISDHDYLKGFLILYTRFGVNEATALSAGLGSHIAFLVDGHLVGSSIAGFAPRAHVPGKSQTVSIGGDDFVALFEPFPGIDRSQHVEFASLVNAQTIMAPYQKTSLIFAGILAVALAISLAVGSLLGRNLVKPIDSLAEAAKSLQAGQWPEPLAVTRNDELGILQDAFNQMVDGLRSSQERLLAMIDHDPLTGLANHRHFKERLDQEAERAIADETDLTVVLMDLDGFGKLNEQFGHRAGDEALKTVARLIADEAGTISVAGRYGADEFGLILPRLNADEAEELIERIRLGLTDELKLSLGLAQLGHGVSRADGLILAAELALARANLLGGDQSCRFDSVPGAEGSDPAKLHAVMADGSLATIQALAAAVDAKDPYTQGHSARVAQYACDLARFAGCSAEEVERIFKSGTLHDVGKIGVPDAILKKPGRLDEDEQQVMETHPVLGEVIVAKVPQLTELLPGVRHHHERWDGKGYPDKLAGEAIPHMARVLAIADTYDAMTSDRPYRKGLPIEVALGEIGKGAGSQFDPTLAPLFIEMMRSQDQARAA